jgi:hypothetical protein
MDKVGMKGHLHHDYNKKRRSQMTPLKPLIQPVIFAISLFFAPFHASPSTLSAADEAAAFTAAGFKHRGNRWQACDDPTPGYSPGVIQMVDDLNGDGRPEAIITEGGSYCYGNAGAGYSLVSKRSDGSWRLITNGTGILQVLPIRGVGGWPDIEIGGPGFCFPVERWNGSRYKLLRYHYEGRPCRPK